MADYELSVRARSDLRSIYRFSAYTFGIDTADAYVRSIRKQLSSIAENPWLGRRADHLKRGCFRREVGSHVVFYRVRKSGPFVMRILRKGMDAGRHL